MSKYYSKKITIALPIISLIILATGIYLYANSKSKDIEYLKGEAKTETCYEPIITCEEALRIDFPEYNDKDVYCKLCRERGWDCVSEKKYEPYSCSCYEILEKGKDGQYSKTSNKTSSEKLSWFEVKESFYEEVPCNN